MIRLNNIKLCTSRLDIIPLSMSRLLMYSTFDYLLEEELGVIKHKRVLPSELTYTLGQFMVPYVTQHPQQILFGTLWVIIDRNTNIIVGDVGFKGEPSNHGLVEIGYGIYPNFENMGIMTEALQCMIIWAFQQPKVDIIVAETDKSNLSSQKVLTKTKFSPFAETESAYWWRLDKDVVSALVS